MPKKRPPAYYPLLRPEPPANLPPRPLVTVTRSLQAQWNCQACPMTLDDPAPQVLMLTLTFALSATTGTQLRYCEAHYAALVATLQAESAAGKEG